jgi:hypothetical protein
VLRISRRALSLAIGLAALGAGQEASAGDDFQFWSEAGVEVPVREHVRAALRSEARLLEDASRLRLYNGDLALARLLSEHAAIALGFTRERARSDGRSLLEDRPRVDLMLRAQLLGVELSSRQRLEARFLEARRDLWRYRHRLEAVAPLALWRAGPRPFLSEEIFVESDGRGFDHNRVQAGLRAAIRGLHLTAYCMLVSSDREGWEHAHALGFGLTWSLGGPPRMSDGR